MVTPPDHRGGGVAIERTADGGCGVDEVSGVHGEFRSAWRGREQKDVTRCVCVYVCLCVWYACVWYAIVCACV